MSDRALLRTYLRPHLTRAMLLGFLLLSAIALQLANPLIARAFIDGALAGEALDRLGWLAVGFLGVVALSQVASVAETYVAEDLGWRTTNELRADLSAHVLALDGSFHADHTAGELIERVDGDVASIAGFFSRFVVSVFGNVLFLLGVLGLLLREDVRIGSLLTACALGAFVYMTRGGGSVGRRSRDAREATATLSGFLEERLGGLTDIKTSGADEHAMRGLHLRIADRVRTTNRAVLAGASFQAVVALLFTAGTGGSLAVGATRHSSGALTIGTIYLVFRYTAMLRFPLERLTREMGSFQRATGSLVRIRELFARTSEVADGNGVPIPDGAPALDVDRVTFAYGDEPVLRDVSFCVEPGGVVGLLGRTGSGKTTITRLLFRFHDPSSGSVRLGGVDIREAGLDDLRARIGLVTQDVQLFEGTLRDNVTMFDDTVDDDRLVEIFTTLGLDAWLRALPDGLDTELGVTARGLSAGEAQLVALARVFLRDPAIVVLDEASSRLDPSTERFVEGAIGRLLDGRTAIVIAHRMATVERADTIVILDDGRVVESGDRRALAADPGSRFASLLRAGMSEVLA